MRILQVVNHDLVHLHHSLHDRTRFDRVGITHQFAEGFGDDLPGQAELIFEPAAAAFGAAFGKLFPQFVDFGLRVAADEERDGFIELVHGAGIQRDEFLAEHLECGGYHLAVDARDVQGFSLFED